MPKLQIKLNTDSLNKIADMSPALDRAITSALADTLVQIESQWESLARSNLRSGKAAYIDGLSIQMKDAYSGSVVLQGDFPLKLEKGSPPYDLKALFAQSSKLKFSKSGGWYINIPLRQGTPNSMNMSSKLTNTVYTQAKKLAPWGVLRTDQGRTESWNGYQYSTSTYDYLTKTRAQQGSKTLNAYMIWRRVSDKSSPDAWIHPGFKGVHLADQISSYADMLLDTTAKDYINKVFGF